MDENVRKLRVGIFVLMAILILMILIVINSEGWVAQYDVFVKPERAPGVTVGTPVRKSGILIGRVKEVTPDDENGNVRLRLGINEGNRIYENEICSIGTESVFGDAVVEFLPLSKEFRGEQIGADFTMETVSIEKDPMEVVTSFGDLKPQLQETLEVIKGAGKSVEDAGEKIAGLSQSVQKTLQDEQGEFKRLMADMRGLALRGQLAADNFNAMFEKIVAVLDDVELKEQFQKTLSEIPKIFQEIRVTVEDTRTAIQKFGTLPEKVDKTLANVEVFSESLKENGPKILTQVNTSLKNVDKFVEELKGVSKTLEKFKDADGTIVKLFEEDELYDSLIEMVERVKKETIRLGPLMDDLRLTADAVARDPGVVGVRGALDRRPSKTGYKGNAGRDRILDFPKRD